MVVVVAGPSLKYYSISQWHLLQVVLLVRQGSFLVTLTQGTPPVLKIVRRVNFGTGRKFGMDVAKRYGERSEMLVLLGKRGRKTVQTVKNYSGSKILRIRRRTIFSTEGSFGSASTPPTPKQPAQAENIERERWNNRHCREFLAG